MFDTIGKTRKQSRGRQAGSLAASLAVNGGIIAALMWAGQKVVEQVQDDKAVEVEYFEEAAPPPPPAPAPPPPPPPPARKKNPDVKQPDPEDIEPDPMTMPEPTPEVLDEVDPEAEEVGSVDAGEEGGVEGGVAGGVVGGTLGGQLGGQLGGDLDHAKAVHWSQVKPKRRVQPKFPEAAKTLGINEERCIVRFFINEKGKPYDVRVEKCPSVFHDSLLQAAWQWRFYPMKVEGKAIKAQFQLSVLFRLK